MIDQIIILFTKTRCTKLDFAPGIRIPVPEKGQPAWVDGITKVRDQYLVNISNRKDKSILNLNSLESNVLIIIHKRMYDLIGNK